MVLATKLNRGMGGDTNITPTGEVGKALQQRMAKLPDWPCPVDRGKHDLAIHVRVFSLPQAVSDLLAGLRMFSDPFNVSDTYCRKCRIIFNTEEAEDPVIGTLKRFSKAGKRSRPKC
ncbi:MAG: hypothetical protein Q8P13_02595 [bacterium]|nr:hypothetical protein [bacterium]